MSSGVNNNHSQKKSIGKKYGGSSRKKEPVKPKQQRESGLGCAGREIKKREREREGERVGHWVRIASELRVQHIHIIMASTERDYFQSL